ncbi:phage/plasmid replication protein [Acidovorax sp. SRB_24]|uniref:phage/plasmid replication domain-containing protein n=1 Tax=Acidovorax sp. SRB_24 TaxID=1962700 RepID=UPI00145D48FF|nr:phage/plasmid replication protein [Acidovorax sp. SRB_24]
MIDYFDITIRGGDFPEIGKAVMTRHPGGAKTKSFTEVKVCADKEAPHFAARVETRAERMRFSGSPALWLQGHNGMGSNDFTALVKASVLLVFETLKLECPASVSDALNTGNYAVDEVHVAEHYTMPKGLIPGLCDNIRRNADPALEAVPIRPGIGVRLYPQSRDRQAILYDKYHYFLDGLQKHKRKLLGRMSMDFDRIGTSLYFEQMMEQYLAHGARLETRHKRCLKNKNCPLDHGSLWHPETARALHIEMVKSIPLQDLPPLDKRELLLQTAKLEHRTLIALWLDGRHPMDFCKSPATYYRRRLEIIQQYGIDLSIPALQDDALSWAAITDPAAIMEVPAWALEGGFVYEPSRWYGWSDASQNARAWLRA